MSCSMCYDKYMIDWLTNKRRKRLNGRSILRECAWKWDHIAWLQSLGQPLKQEDCFSVVLCEGRDASPDLLHQFYGLLTESMNLRPASGTKIFKLLIILGLVVLVVCHLLSCHAMLSCCETQMRLSKSVRTWCPMGHVINFLLTQDTSACVVWSPNRTGSH